MLAPERILGHERPCRPAMPVFAGPPARESLIDEAIEMPQRPSADAIAERLQWWAELFEPPCVGFVATFDEAREFAAAGADFVLVGDLIWDDSRGPAAALVDAQQAIRQGHAMSGTSRSGMMPA